VPPRAKRFEYAVSVDPGGQAHAEDGGPLELDESWTPEHLVLAGLVRCTLESLRYHAGRAGISVRGGGTVTGVVTRRDDDGRYGLVEADCRLDVELEPLPGDEPLAELLAKAERDCFVGASLRAAPRYEWRVNGRPAR
jgi:organic hydroperoxide reductase OsmC/OhrA